MKKWKKKWRMNRTINKKEEEEKLQILLLLIITASAINVNSKSKIIVIVILAGMVYKYMYFVWSISEIFLIFSQISKPIFSSLAAQNIKLQKHQRTFQNSSVHPKKTDSFLN